jgi:polar amino acid transport system substrate-binding protein
MEVGQMRALVTQARRRRGLCNGPVALMFAMAWMHVTTLLVTPVFGEPVNLTAFDYPPYMDAASPAKGLFCELVYEAYRSVGYEATFRFYPLKRSTQYVIHGQALAQLGTEWNFPEPARKTAVQSVPLFYYRVVGFHLKDRFQNISFSSLKDLQGYRLGVIRGSSDAAILKKHPDLNLMVDEVGLMSQLFKKLYLGRNDIVFTVELSGLKLIAAQYPKELDRWVMTEDAIQGILAQVVFSKAYPNSEIYLNAFKEGVARIRANGTYLRVFEKYYGVGRVPGVTGDLMREIYVIPKE